MSLTLNGESLASESIETTIIIQITAGDGHCAGSGRVTIEGAIISTDVSLEHADEYTTVDWHSLSADGCPIEGTYTFTYVAEKEAEHPKDEGKPTGAATSLAAKPEPIPTSDYSTFTRDCRTVDANRPARMRTVSLA